MGEYSKKLGDDGEQRLKHLLTQIGWAPLSNSFDIKCSYGQKHKKKQESPARQTHGIDFAFTYVCPIVPSRRRNILISSKDSSEDRTRVKRELIKNDLKDLAWALECFKRSPDRGRMTQSGGGATSVEDIGVLFRLNKDPSSEGSHLGNDVGRERLDIESANALYLIENARFDHVERVMKHVAAYFDGSGHSFALPKTALNIAANTRRTDSELLPVQSLIGGPLGIRITPRLAASEAELALYSDEPFDLESFERLTSLAYELSSNWVKVNLVFPDYQKHKHGELVQQVLTGMDQKDFARKVACVSLQERSRLQ